MLNCHRVGSEWFSGCLSFSVMFRNCMMSVAGYSYMSIMQQYEYKFMSVWVCLESNMWNPRKYCSNIQIFWIALEVFRFLPSWAVCACGFLSCPSEHCPVFPHLMIKICCPSVFNLFVCTLLWGTYCSLSVSGLFSSTPIKKKSCVFTFLEIPIFK